MKLVINKNVKFVLIENVQIVGNLDNGSFIGLSLEGSKLFKRIEDGEDVEYERLNADMLDLINSAIEMGILCTSVDASVNHPKINSAYLHVTNNCNFNCIGCYSHNENRNNHSDLSLVQITMILDELKKSGLSTLLISGGEPFLRDDLHQIVAYAKKIGIKEVIIGTNGSCIDIKMLENMKDYVDRIMLAIDSYAIDGPRFIRDEGSTKKAISSIHNIKRCGIPVSILPTVHSKNYMYIENYLSLAKDLEVPIAFSVLTCNPHISPLGEYVLSDYEFYKMITSFTDESKPIFNDVSGDLNNISFRASCGAGSKMISVDALGNVFPCHMMHYNEYKLGNLLETSLQSILSSEGAIKFKNTTVVDETPGCSDCSYRYFCGGGCKARRFFVEGKIGSKDCYCESYLYNYKKIGEYLLSFNATE